MKVSRRTFAAGLAAAVAGAPALLAQHSNVKTGKWRVGHHFWNWDHAWNKGDFLAERLRLTKETGYEGWEAKPEEIGRPAAEMRAACDALGIACAAIGGDVKPAVEYAQAAGVTIVRTTFSKEDNRRWVDYGAERGIIFVVHPHAAPGGAANAVETREDLLRYLEQHPGVYACPDTGHLALCGSDPVQTIRDLGPLCRYIHLKDIRPDRVGKKDGAGEKFCELGTGALDLAGVIRALEAIDYEGWIMVERDSREPDYIKSARNMRAVMRTFGY